MDSNSWRRGQRDDFTLPELMNAVWGRRLLVGGFAATLMLCSLVFSLSREPVYVAEATIAVEPEAFGVAEDSEAMARGTMNAVAGESPGLLGEARRRAGWTASPQEFNERLAVEPDENTAEIHVSFSAARAEEAARAAQAYADAFVERAEDLNQQRLAGVALDASARVAQPATTPGGRSYPRPLLYGALAGGVGLLLGGAIALALESGTRSWRGPRDAELTLRAPVLGVIPDYQEQASEEKVG